MEKDIVYFVKDTKENEELRYSLRSVERNFPHRRVWFFGGCPDGIEPDVHVPARQNQRNKYMRVRNMIRIALDTKEISDDFWLFNDDFFVMSKVGYVIPTVDGSLARKIQLIEQRYKTKTSYTNRLRNTIYALKSRDCDRLSYEMHIPMEINKAKASVILEAFDDNTAFRSTYGNYYSLARSIQPDVKIHSPEGMYDPDVHNVFLSTSDKSFSRGRIGEYIRRTFTTPSRFEIDEES